MSDSLPSKEQFTSSAALSKARYFVNNWLFTSADRHSVCKEWPKEMLHDAALMLLAWSRDRETPEIEKLRLALFKVLGHTAYHPPGSLELLAGLIASIKRITNGVLSGEPPSPVETSDEWRDAYQRAIGGPDGLLAQLQRERERRIAAENRATELAKQDEVHWKTRRTLLKEIAQLKSQDGSPEETKPVPTPCDDCKADRDRMRKALLCISTSSSLDEIATLTFEGLNGPPPSLVKTTYICPGGMLGRNDLCPADHSPEKASPDSLPTCGCKWSDAWKCASKQRLGTVTCHCACHRTAQNGKGDQT